MCHAKRASAPAARVRSGRPAPASCAPCTHLSSMTAGRPSRPGRAIRQAASASGPGAVRCHSEPRPLEGTVHAARTARTRSACPDAARLRDPVGLRDTPTDHCRRRCRVRSQPSYRRRWRRCSPREWLHRHSDKRERDRKQRHSIVYAFSHWPLSVRQPLRQLQPPAPLGQLRDSQRQWPSTRPLIGSLAPSAADANALAIRGLSNPHQRFGVDRCGGLTLD